MQSRANCSPPLDSLISREKTGNYRFLGRFRGLRRPNSRGLTRAFLPNSLLNRTGNFNHRTGNYFGSIGELSGSSRELMAFGGQLLQREEEWCPWSLDLRRPTVSRGQAEFERRRRDSQAARLTWCGRGPDQANSCPALVVPSIGSVSGSASASFSLSQSWRHWVRENFRRAPSSSLFHSQSHPAEPHRTRGMPRHAVDPVFLRSELAAAFSAVRRPVQLRPRLELPRGQARTS
jgi:hypothetical protein